MTSRKARQETAGWTRETGKAWKAMVGVRRETAEVVAVEPASCYQEREEGKWETLGNREVMALETDEEGMVLWEAGDDGAWVI